MAGEPHDVRRGHYHIHFDNDYSSSVDRDTERPHYFASGSSVTKGVEAESSILVGGGFSVYVNGDVRQRDYIDTGLHVQNAPRQHRGAGPHLPDRELERGLLHQARGQMFNDNGASHEAVSDRARSR